MYRLVSPMSSDGWTLRRDHKDILARLSARKPPHRAYDEAQDCLEELPLDPRRFRGVPSRWFSWGERM